jgi:hypothetical protein
MRDLQISFENERRSKQTGTKTEKGSGQNPQTSDHIIVDVFVVVGLVFFFVCSST